MKESYKIIFFGTSDFAVPTLKALYDEGYSVCLVITQPDQPVGRKQTVTPSAIKAASQALGLEVIHDLKIEGLKDCRAEVGVVVAYGEIIPKEILDLFPLGILNIHPSLLPKYRGPSPIQAAILNGDKETGVTIIKLDEKMDHGSRVSCIVYRVSENDTYESLSRKLAEEGAKLLIETLPDYLEGKIKLVPQDDSQATFTRILKREDGKIDWQKSAVEIERQIRAYAPWPGCFTEFIINGKKINVKIIFARVYDNVGAQNFVPLPDDNQTTIGQFSIIRQRRTRLWRENGRLFVQCGHGALLIEKLQPEGRKPMTAKEFINGYLQ